MGIRDIIQQKKREFFVARDKDKRELQYAELSKQRQELEKEAKLRADIQKEQKAIRDIRSEPARQRLASIGQGFKNLAAGAQRGSKAIKGFSSTSASNPFATTNPNPFTTSPAKPEAKPKTRTITIKLNE